MRIFCTGAHSVGKTTLARYISDRYGLPLVTEVARAVLNETETRFDQIRVDMGRVAQYQHEVFKRQGAAEKAAGENFVSDRAFDHIAYAAEHSLIVADLIESPEFKTYVEGMRQGLIFFVRPCKELLHEDGVRESPVWDGVVRIDAMIKLLLEQWRLPYLSIHSSSLQERVRAVEFVLRSAWPQRKN